MKSSEGRTGKLQAKRAFTASFGSIQQGALQKEEYIHYLKEQLRAGHNEAESIEQKNAKQLTSSASFKIPKGGGAKITSAFANYNKLVRRFQKSALQLHKVPSASHRSREYRTHFYSGAAADKNTSVAAALSSSSIDKTLGKSFNTSGAVRTRSPQLKGASSSTLKKGGNSNYASSSGVAHKGAYSKKSD